jgi:hypothetical protein
MAESSTDLLWKEYKHAFEDFDDLTLARWLAQTLGQLQGRAWRFSHPLVTAYRLAAELAHERQIWHKRLVSFPSTFIESPCCRAPLLPLFTRDILEMGLVCQHCSETAIPLDEIPSELRPAVQTWANEYGEAHAVAHWDDRQRRNEADYDKQFEDAAQRAERLLTQAGGELMPQFLDYYPAIIWEDQDECLEVRPDDILL